MAEQKWSNLDYPHMAEGWHFPTPNGREHYFRDGRSFCGRYRIEPGARIAGRMDEPYEDPCVTCDRVITAEMRRLWCEHGDPRDECPDCTEAAPLHPHGASCAGSQNRETDEPKEGER